MYDNEFYSRMYSSALLLATKYHSGQYRKDGTPYIIHPIRVSQILAKQGYNIDYQIVALLHDTLEDTSISEREIREFDYDILEAVQLLSKNYCKNKNKYIENILNNNLAKAVKNADRIDNLLDLKNSNDNEFIKKYLKDTEENFVGKFSDELDKAYEQAKKDYEKRAH